MKSALPSIAGLILLAAVGVASGQEALTHTKDTLEDVKKNVAAGKAVIVDVREQAEWDEGHLKGAILVPKSKLDAGTEIEALLKKVPKDKIVYTHCRAGRRALACGEILKKHGFDVRPLAPGFADLVAAGLEKEEKKP